MAGGRELVRVRERFGWYVDRVRGRHHIMRHGGRRTVTISLPAHGSQTLPLGTLLGILEDAGITVEEFNREA